MIRRVWILLALCLSLGCAGSNYADSNVAKNINAGTIFAQQAFTNKDAVLVSDQFGNIVYQWRAEQPLIPGSLMKLPMAHLAIEKWGLRHRFVTEFYLIDSQLWVKGYGDPYLVSEELDLVAANLNERLVKMPSSVHIDASYFAPQEGAPGRSNVSDPYDAPPSAVAVNFNTVTLTKVGKKIASAEPQTPLTKVAKQLGQRVKIGDQATRVNLGDAGTAQQHFSQLLLAKLKMSPSTPIVDNQALPEGAKLIYRHQNSRDLAEVLRGTLEYSNNFIANQLFLLLGEKQMEQMRFLKSSEIAEKQLKQRFAWATVAMLDGSGLSRENQFSAKQIDEVLTQLAPHKGLLKEYLIDSGAQRSVRAKTGTLNKVHNFAGYITLAEQRYQFVFIFNRAMPYRYRETLLASLVKQLAEHSKSENQSL
jgi:D-alanyl-D-alanine carboxypeptidase/D-alanyl-D-alanine-endopeptidase (penicillin-binding protein 4)